MSGYVVLIHTGNLAHALGASGGNDSGAEECEHAGEFVLRTPAMSHVGLSGGGRFVARLAAVV